MKTLYFDCGMGAAGDMLAAALLELTPDPEQTIINLNHLEIPGTVFIKETAEKCGISGTHIRVITEAGEEDEHMHEHTHEHHHDHDHSHAGMEGIRHIVNDHIRVSDKVRQDILAVYQILAEAESAVHNTDIEHIHFHEVGTMDAIADITAVCWLIDQLKADEIIASPIHVGRGTVKCAHGILPVPAPAAAVILKGIPIYSRELVEGELCTPTGAALLKHFAKEFRQMPMMSVTGIGYGLGKKDFPIANCVRAVLGTRESEETDQISELAFNVDDMTGEEIGYLTEKLLKEGAREVFVTPVYMKKNRPGNLITVICTLDRKKELISLIFRHSTTIGIRESVRNRYVLARESAVTETPFGTIRRKDSSGYGVTRSKYEYDDLAGIAEETGLSIREVLDQVEKNRE